MAALNPPVCDYGWKAADFELPDGEGNFYTLKGLAGDKGILVMFICNHCPFVRSITERLIPEMLELQKMGFGVVAISSNDAQSHPDDAPDKMVAFARERGFTFPYLYDESQDVAKAYGAVCTPDFFGFNDRLELQYRGRLDEGRTSPPPPGAKRELYQAMAKIADTGKGPRDQIPSVGCSIKWKS